MKAHKWFGEKPFITERGDAIENLEVTYHTSGKLNSDKSNVIWVCHALTANSDVEDWWPQVIGEAGFFRPSEYFIVCVNMLGSPYGSSSPVSEKETGGKYFLDFPQITNRDVARTFDLVREELGIEQINVLIGASLGGQQALEWCVLNPAAITNLVLIATNAIHSPWGVAFNESQRLAIEADATWKENSLEAGKSGLKAARSIALLSYRTVTAYNNTQPRLRTEKLGDALSAQSYQQYQGEKLIDRFNAHCYYRLTQLMDSHNIGRDRADILEVLQSVKAKTLVVSMENDLLFPPSEQQFIAANIEDAEWVEVSTQYGHDGFLIESEALGHLFQDFLRRSRAEIELA